MTKFSITITSDIVCPWCYIGHTRLARAITNHRKSHAEDTFHLRYLPFYLNPPQQLANNNTATPFPVLSRPRREMYAEKFGSQRSQQIEAMMRDVSRAEGLNFKFGGQTGSSRNGHRLVYFAQQQGGEEAQNRVMIGLWRRYFEEEVDVTTLEVLTAVGVEAELGGEGEVRDFLVSGRGGREVDELAEEARRRGVSGVPNYVVQGVWEVSGAQEPPAFERLFGRWKEREREKGGSGSL